MFENTSTSMWKRTEYASVHLYAGPFFESMLFCDALHPTCCVMRRRCTLFVMCDVYSRCSRSWWWKTTTPTMTTGWKKPTSSSRLVTGWDVCTVPSRKWLIFSSEVYVWWLSQECNHLRERYFLLLVRWQLATSMILPLERSSPPNKSPPVTLWSVNNEILNVEDLSKTWRRFCFQHRAPGTYQTNCF